MKSFMQHLDEVTLVRVLCAVLAAVIVVDALSVAPNLVILAIPFVLAAVFFRRGGMAATVTLALLAALFAVLGINLAASNGFDAGWADLLFAYIGTPIALAIVGLDLHHRVHTTHRHA